MLVTPLPRIGPPPEAPDLSALDRAERRALRLLALHEVALTIGGHSDLAQTFELILAQARSLLRAPAGSIYLWDEAGGLLRCSLVHGAPDSLLDRTMRPGEGAAGLAFRDCKTVLVNSYRAWAGASERGRELGIEAAVSVPLRTGERLLGALSVYIYAPSQTFGDEDAWMLELLGDQAALAIEQARLVEQTERRSARLLALHRVATSITAQADVGATLALILSQAVELLQRQGGTVYLWDEASRQLTLAQAHGLPTNKLPRVLASGQGLNGQTWLRGSACLVDDYRRWEHAVPRERSAGIVRGAGVPLVVAGRQLGVLAVVADASSPTFTPEEVQLLELLAGQAAVALENARLFEAAARARALEELNRLKSEFISTVSHELRTPLTYIHGYAELLLRRQFEPDMAAEAVGEIHGAAVRMARLVDDLLDLSRMEAGRLTLRPTRIELPELLRAAAAASGVQAGREIRLELAELPPLLADPDRLRQVLDNLLSNAQRYAPSGRVTVRARADGERVRVEVIDEGPGLSREEQARVFEPFYRGANSEVLPLRGGGLGLTIVRRLVEAHGGRVGLTSRPGRGSTFWFTLPVGPSAGASERALASRARSLPRYQTASGN